MKKIFSQGCRVFTLDDGRTVVLGNDGSTGTRRDGNFHGQSKFQRKETEDAIFISMKKQPEEPPPRTPSLPRVPWIPAMNPSLGRVPADMTLSGDYSFYYSLDSEPVFHDLPYSNLYAVYGSGSDFIVKYYLDDVYDTEVVVHAGETDTYWLYGLSPGETSTTIELWFGLTKLERLKKIFYADGSVNEMHEFFY